MKFPPFLVDFARRLRPAEAKASATRRLASLEARPRARWTTRDFATLAREGYAKNPVVQRAVRLVATAAGATPLLLAEGGRELDGHPLLGLLARPNPRMAGPAFVEAIAAHLLLAGNAYVELVTLDGSPRELHVLRPDRMRVVAGDDGWAEAYDYLLGPRALRFPLGEAGVAPILHLALFHPLDDHYGLAPIEAAGRAIDLHNAATQWNKALLDNAARPSGALVYAGPGGQALSEAQYERLKEEIERTLSGPANAGRPLLLDGGLDWRAMSFSPRDMDFMEARHAAAREIALAFGVPPVLIGLPGDSTYANLAEANRALWRETVLPLVGRIASELAAWLGPAYGAQLRLEADLDRIEALAAEREALWRRVEAASFLTTDEKRAAVGYGSLEASP